MFPKWAVFQLRGQGGKGAQGSWTLSSQMWTASKSNKSFKRDFSELPLCKEAVCLHNRNSHSVETARTQAPFKTNPKLKSCITTFFYQSCMKENLLKTQKKIWAQEWIIRAMKISEMPVLGRKLHAFSGMIFPAQFQCQTFISILYFCHQNTEAEINPEQVMHHSSQKAVFHWQF